jgi:creatinine amidohydrolase/Fe(II)-dependent formamide hydrolase-like protein
MWQLNVRLFDSIEFLSANKQTSYKQSMITSIKIQTYLFLSLKPEEIRDDDAIDKFEINTIEALPVMYNYLVAETAKDTELQEHFQGLQNGTELKMKTRFYIRKIRQGNLVVER